MHGNKLDVYNYGMKKLDIKNAPGYIEYADAKKSSFYENF